jgi:hypothetical protein
MFAKKMLVALLIGAFTCVTFAQDAKRVYLGVRAGAGVGLSSLGEKQEKTFTDLGGTITRGGASFDVAPFVSLQLADVFALQTELLFTKFGIGQNISIMGYDMETNITRSAMAIPVLAKMTFRPENLSISAFVGPHFTVNMGKWNIDANVAGIEAKQEYTDDEFKKYLADTYEADSTDLKFAPVGLTAGLSFGFAAGPGNLFFDVRFLTDLGMAKLTAYLDDEKEEEDFLRRAKLSFTVGYEFGAGSR